MRSAADAHPIAVAGLDDDLVGGDAEPFLDQLREAGRMALPRGQRADHDLDRAVAAHRHLGALQGAPLCNST